MKQIFKVLGLVFGGIVVGGVLQDKTDFIGKGKKLATDCVDKAKEKLQAAEEEAEEALDPKPAEEAPKPEQEQPAPAAPAE